MKERDREHWRGRQRGKEAELKPRLFWVDGATDRWRSLSPRNKNTPKATT